VCVSFLSVGDPSDSEGIVTLVEAFRNQLHLATLATTLSLTLSRSPQLLLVLNSTVLRMKRHLVYVSIVKTWTHHVSLSPATGKDDVPVQLVSTVPLPVTQSHVNSTVVQKPQEVDPRFEGHCSLVTLVRPDHSRHIVRALLDTGALQSLVSLPAVC